MHNVTERVYIFSVYNSTRSLQENQEVHARHIDLLKSKGYSPGQVQGKYNGIDEEAIFIYGTNLTEPVIQEFAKAQLQESYLIVYHDGVAELVFSDGNRKIIGDFVNTTEEIAKSKDSYSKIGNQWFIVE